MPDFSNLESIDLIKKIAALPIGNLTKNILKKNEYP